MDYKKFLSKNIKIRHLRVLLEVEKLGQLSKVAALLNVSQPAVSKTLAEIESGIGLKLFERAPQGLVPNEFGEVVIRAASEIMSSLQRAGEELNFLTHGINESLAIGTMPFGALSVISHAIALNSRVREGLSVSVVEGRVVELLPELVADRIQILVGGTRSRLPESVIAHPLYVESVGFAIAPHHPLAQRSEITWEEAMPFPWVLPPLDHVLRSAFENALRKAGLAIPLRTINSTMADLGLGLLSQHNAIVLMTSHQIKFMEKLNVARALPSSPADHLGLIVNVAAFVSLQRETQNNIQSLLESLRIAAARSQDW